MTVRTWTTRVLAPTIAAVAVCVAGAVAQAQDAQALDDARIAHVAVTANAIDVELAELAVERASDARVRQFAQTMISDHRSVNEAAGALAERLGVTPADNALSRGLRQDAAEARSRLEALNGTDFDRAYMDREVAYHRAVVEALDDTLIPNTSNAELRSLLENARQAVAGHLEHAVRLREALGGDS